MFGVPDQFHQFISSSSAPPAITLPFPPPLHHASSTNLSPHFNDPLYTPNSHTFFQLHHKISQEKDAGAALNMEISSNHPNPWSSEEVLALLRVRSSLENWFPEFTWEHVSRKLADLGFQRSAEKCKEKFDEESKNFNNCNKNLRFFSELEELCHGDQHNNPLPPPPAEAEKSKIIWENPNDDADENEPPNATFMRGHSKPGLLAESAQGVRISDEVNTNQKKTKDCDEKEIDEELAKSKKRKKENRLGIFKGFCEDVVNKMLAQQEELHSKLLEDMVRRDEAKVVKEEAWKKQEMDRINKELELRAKEQAIAEDRQATWVELLSKFVPNAKSDITTSSTSPTMQYCSLLASQAQYTNLTNNQTKIDQLLSPSSMNEKNTNSPTTPKAPKNPNSPKTWKSTPTSLKECLGKRWPKDQVLALINLRCSLFNGASEEKEGGGSGLKAPLWERISQGMMELGYKRSAKRCKEKWENINKYFRKTKHNSKRRSLDSKTCPYFHQLSNLYSQGTLMAPSEGKENSPTAQVPCFDFEA